MVLFQFETLDRIFYIAHVSKGRIEILATTLASNFEAADLGLVVVDLWRQDHSHGVVHQEHLREARAEAGTIDVDLTGLGKVHLLAPWAEILEP